MAAHAFMNCGYVVDVCPMSVFTARRQILVGHDNVDNLPYQHTSEPDQVV